MPAEVERFGHHRNSFGFLRLAFAALVIVAHTPELYDGNRSRELLTMAFGTITFGELAVDGFFLVSGYLITGSWLKNPDVGAYLRKRVARIFPAFLVCSAITVLLVAPLAGASLNGSSLLLNLRLSFQLAAPIVNYVFLKTPYPALNGAAWTIPYEFRCYLIVIILGLLGAFRRPWIIGALVGLEYLGYHAVPATWSPDIPFYGTLFGSVHESFRLVSVFLIGSLFYLWREAIVFTRRGVLVSCLALPVCLLFTLTAHLGVMAFGGYLTFAIAAHGKGALTEINNRNDVSYGLYLYAWPIEKLLMWFLPALPLVAYGVLTLALSYAAGWTSWLLVEKATLSKFGR